MDKLWGIPGDGSGDLNGKKAYNSVMNKHSKHCNIKNYFAGLALDRAAGMRRDPQWLQRRMQAADSRFVPVWRERNLLRTDASAAALLTRGEADPWLEVADAVVFLGEDGDSAYFALILDGGDDAVPAQLAKFGEFHQLKGAAEGLGEEERGLLAYARAMAHWHGRQRFCCDCGAPTHCSSDGHVRICSSSDCGREHFPRTDAAVIVVVEHEDSCLLVRQPRWREGLYSALAGFVEAGESVEDAVVREVFEEAGVRVIGQRYHSSQPWPFPSSLMLGFEAIAAKQEVNPGDDELEDARWFTREEYAAALTSGEVKMPSRPSIARRLITDWYSRDGAVLPEVD